MSMRFDVITLLPELVQSVVQYEIVTSRALERQLIELHLWNPRDYALDVHRTVDDRPYGGGPGMVMKADKLRIICCPPPTKQHNTGLVVYLSLRDVR